MAEVHPAPRRRSRPGHGDDEHGRGPDAPRSGRRGARAPSATWCTSAASCRTRRAWGPPTCSRSGTWPSRSIGPATRGAPWRRPRRPRTSIWADGRARTSSRRTRTSSSCRTGSASGTSRSARRPRRARRRTPRDAAVLWAAAERALAEYVESRGGRRGPRPMAGHRSRATGASPCRAARRRQARGEAPRAAARQGDAVDRRLTAREGTRSTRCARAATSRRAGTPIRWASCIATATRPIASSSRSWPHASRSATRR